MFRLLNEPTWIQFIGDKHIHSIADAENYISDVYQKMYRETGYGLLLVRLKSNQTPIGLCGLIKREGLDDVDLGFAFLPEYWGAGYAKEASLACLSYGKTQHNLTRVVAITLEENSDCKKLLSALGFQFRTHMHLNGDSEELELHELFL